MLTDEKKANNLNIALSKLRKHTMNDLKNALIEINTNIINLETAQCLLKFLPENDELNVVKSKL